MTRKVFICQNFSVEHNSTLNEKHIYFRETYDVDLSTFNFNSSIEEEKVYNEVIQGIGYDILKGLFDPLEIKHARETILYLISKQGSKATHFQVCLSSLITIKP